MATASTRLLRWTQRPEAFRARCRARSMQRVSQQIQDDDITIQSIPSRHVEVSDSSSDLLARVAQDHLALSIPWQKLEREYRPLCQFQIGRRGRGAARSPAGPSRPRAPAAASRTPLLRRRSRAGTRSGMAHMDAAGADRSGSQRSGRQGSNLRGRRQALRSNVSCEPDPTRPPAPAFGSGILAHQHGPHHRERILVRRSPQDCGGGGGPNLHIFVSEQPADPLGRNRGLHGEGVGLARTAARGGLRLRI